jgi:5-methylthioribose kinase
VVGRRRRLRNFRFGVDAQQLKPLAAEAINPPLCKITELPVFSEPYSAGGRHTVPLASRADVAAYADDPDVIAAIGAVKWNFMTRAEALIHGDLHTGSVMVRGECDPSGASTRRSTANSRSTARSGSTSDSCDRTF